MTRIVSLILLSGLCAAACNEALAVDGPAESSPLKLGLALAQIPPPAAVVKIDSFDRQQSGPLYYKNRVTMVSVDVKAIFWGRSWQGGQTDKISGMDSWFSGFEQSSYAQLSGEFLAPNAPEITRVATYRGHIIDSSSAPSETVSAQRVLDEVCRYVSQGRIVVDPAGNGFYPVYIDTPRSSLPYCSWHSYGTCTVNDQRIRVQFALVLNADNDEGCQVTNDDSGHSAGLAAIANLTAAELSSTRTDPTGEGWQDIFGMEQGIKCLWVLPPDLVTLKNGSKWKMQTQWSNRAFFESSGLPNASGQDGCIGVAAG